MSAVMLGDNVLFFPERFLIEYISMSSVTKWLCSISGWTWLASQMARSPNTRYTERFCIWIRLRPVLGCQFSKWYCFVFGCEGRFENYSVFILFLKWKFFTTSVWWLATYQHKVDCGTSGEEKQSYNSAGSPDFEARFPHCMMTSAVPYWCPYSSTFGSSIQIVRRKQWGISEGGK